MIGLRTRFTGTLLFALLGLSLIAPQPALAQCAGGDNRNILGFPTWDSYLEHNPDCSITNFDFPQDLFLVLLALVEIMIRLSAYIAVGFIIYGGFKLMIAQGQPDKLAQAKTLIYDAIIGLVIAILAVVIVTFVATRF